MGEDGLSHDFCNTKAVGPRAFKLLLRAIVSYDNLNHLHWCAVAAPYQHSVIPPSFVLTDHFKYDSVRLTVKGRKLDAFFAFVAHLLEHNDNVSGTLEYFADRALSSNVLFAFTATAYAFCASVMREVRGYAALVE
jgi:hypothetical protein